MAWFEVWRCARTMLLMKPSLTFCSSYFLSTILRWLSSIKQTQKRKFTVVCLAKTPEDGLKYEQLMTSFFFASLPFHQWCAVGLYQCHFLPIIPIPSLADSLLKQPIPIVRPIICEIPFSQIVRFRNIDLLLQCIVCTLHRLHMFCCLRSPWYKWWWVH